MGDAPFFDTVRVHVGEGMPDLLSAASDRGINLRVLDEDTVTVALDETTTDADLADLLAALTADADPQPEMFDAVETALIALAADPAAADPRPAEPPAVPLPVVVLAAELALLQAGGHGPAVGRCSGCGTRLVPAARSAFGLLDGGALCPRCRHGKHSVVAISTAGTAALRAAAALAVGRSGGAVPTEERVLGELRAVMNTFVAHTLGRRLKTAKHLKLLPRTNTYEPT